MTAPNFPLVSCIMPTRDRLTFVPQAIQYFLRQDYPSRELIIVDDGTQSVAELIPQDLRLRLRYIRRPPPATIGAKRNLACEEARGEIIVHWDDDDWQAPHRLSYQVESLLQENTDVCGVSTVLFFDVTTGRAWRYVYPAGARCWVYGGTLCYRRSFWANNPFPNIDVGEDAQFVWAGRPDRITPLADPTFYVGIIHPHNTSPKRTTDKCWQSHLAEDIQRLLGADWSFYHPWQVGPPERPAPGSTARPPDERSAGMLTIAHEADLSLPEFAAFNHGQSLPRMRRWEMPFALFQSCLANTMAVLDCTINPVNFQERLARLYPHVLYRHWKPIRDGQFALPVGVPDGVFDRVICINTLEHLLRPQREMLIRAMAQKLKPGGWLILTSDYYFDSFWKQSAFLQAGVMRADHQEIFNGWNKVTVAEYFDLCRRHGLHPLADFAGEPREDDPTLYRNEQPFPHACIAGIFCKGPRGELPRGKKIVLAMLTWNTRDVSVDSLRAHAREARMLRRLGQVPMICICDNGSTDGTAEALKALEAETDVPVRFISNRNNVGNSIARNWIIDAMREWDGDYLLFMDGDIEIVPFSSFAMLRFMENNGHRLGCIGADSAGQTPYRERASGYHYSIDGPVESTNLVAWTQYGMFCRAVFEDGVRFDEMEPFDRVGWGFEDNDLAFQMEMRGYLIQRFLGMTYLHRGVRSSVRIMRQQGIDPVALSARRRQRVIDKWTSIPRISAGPLELVRRMGLDIVG